MHPLVLIPLLLTLPAGDTVRLTPDAALDRAVAQSRQLAAAQAYRRAAEAGVGAARAWRNPTLSILAENLGSQRQVTGYGGLRGTEGQVTLGTWLPLGGDHAAGVREARARADAAGATLALTDLEVRAAALEALALAERDIALARQAAEEADALDRFATGMTLRAGEGRSAGGEAARARLEADLAASRAARRAADALRSTAELSRILGIEPGTPVVIAPASCMAVASAPGGLPLLAVAEAEQRAAEARVAVARARQVPDLMPEVGFRRSAGFSGLLLGVSLDLPLLNRGAAAVAVARAEADAARAQREDVALRLAIALPAAEAALAELEAAGRRFGAQWGADLERSLGAAVARYEAGEGSIADLLDARRARVATLDEYQAWRADRRLARVHVARLGGGGLDASLLCDDDFRSTP